MQKATFITSSLMITPMFERLHAKGLLVGVFFVSENISPQLSEHLKRSGVNWYAETSLEMDKLCSMLAAWDSQCVLTYQYQLDETTDIPRHVPIFQLHLSDFYLSDLDLILFEQIRQGASTLPIRVTSYPEHDLVLRNDVEILPYETTGRLYNKTIEGLSNTVIELSSMLEQSGKTLPELTGATYIPAPTVLTMSEAQLRINWRQQNASQVVDLCRAANPYWGGARIQVGQMTCQLLQVSTSDMPTYGVPAGTILCVSIDQGLLVALMDEAVRIDVVACPEGVFDGYRFAQMVGLQAGILLT
ncbi:hypothetical protein NMZ99_004506 [Vibrio parahaemolyticus]|uniref:hypothetical protein n=1 Tax=Vibrio parahaemolyticus TaxID=670 RepID=UPI000698EF46|nr:hypothetical protein [Vibrio parahaemolyticus]EJG1162005.1 hypothetical protein [Vibrio parahaemolyticus]EJL8304455.1 hypothetical protein [Vibrio parahaemolyticus]EJU9844497.1 hypothetical protein [Vibrio parahaemolyticus]HAS6589285.1 hypothetical protein [Vibrio parahaemolyticus]